MVLICVLPQVALWGKGILCLLVAIFTSLSLFFCVASFSFSSISFFEGGCGFEAILKVFCNIPLWQLATVILARHDLTIGSG